MSEATERRFINRHTGEVAQYVDEERDVVSLALETGPDKEGLIEVSTTELRHHWTEVQQTSNSEERS